MSYLDPYVKSIQELLSQLGTPADRMRAIEAAVERVWQPDESLRAARDMVTGLGAMPGQMRELGELLGQFSSPGPQLRTFQEQLSTTRQQLELMAKQLQAAEAMIGRLADLSEKLAAVQASFTSFTAGWARPAE